jgi:hypothetical protein
VFPAGTWTGLWDGHVITGPDTRTIAAPLDTIPVYLRPGAAIQLQLGFDLQLGTSMRGGRVGVLIVTPPQASMQAAFKGPAGQIAQLSGRRTSSGAQWVLEGLPADTRYLLVYGVTQVSAVRMDGAVLPALEASTAKLPQQGWRLDGAMSRLIVVLVPRPGGDSGSAIRIEVDFHALPDAAQGGQSR